MRVNSIQVGLIAKLEGLGDSVMSGMVKHPISGPIQLHFLGLQGDEQADLKVHGGRDKAVYAYGQDALDQWAKLRPQDLFASGGMGENLTVDFLQEQSLCIGDTFELGSAWIQVSEPRMPCKKLGMLYEDPKMVQQFLEVARPGVYFRVLREGVIQPGDELILVKRESTLLSIEKLFQLCLNKDSEPDSMTELRDGELSLEYFEKILKLESLSDSWKAKLARRRDGGLRPSPGSGNNK
jgi:MOSC domain-containing protein YiiM